jgi:hypothetical protein
MVVTGPVTVNYWMGGRSQPGIDYTLDGPAGHAIIAAGRSSVQVTLHAISDGMKEKNEGARMHLITGPGYIAHKSAWARVIILKSQ